MQKAVRKITDERGWGKFHTPKNMAMDLIRETSEVLEHFVWETDEEILKDKKRIREIEKEMADVLHALLLLADLFGTDLSNIFWKKLDEVQLRYPKEKVYGKSGYVYKKSRRNMR